MVERVVRRERVLGGVIALLLVGDVTMLYLRQGAAPVTADVALEQFRATPPTSPGSTAAPGAQATAAPAPTAAAPSPTPSASPAAVDAPASAAPEGGPAGATPTGPPAAPVPPQDGVYAYRTTGYEEVEAFGGARHDYPAETYMTVRRKGCGVTLRWQPLQERWDESDHCPQGPNITIDRFAMYHEFFQQGEEQAYACTESHVYRAGQPAGASWKVRCSSPEFGDIDMATRVVGVENVQVGAETRRAVRMRYDATISGYSQGTQVQERWIDEATGLMLRITTQVEVSTQTPLGRTPYRERYRIDLLSMQPRT